MTEEEKQAELLNIMGFLEAINTALSQAEAIENMPFEALNPDLWELIQEQQELVRIIIGSIKDQLTQHSEKLIDNDALYAHLQIVMLAP